MVKQMKNYLISITSLIYLSLISFSPAIAQEDKSNLTLSGNEAEVAQVISVSQLSDVQR